jgi:hypothetical protein
MESVEEPDRRYGDRMGRVFWYCEPNLRTRTNSGYLARLAPEPAFRQILDIRELRFAA